MNSDERLGRALRTAYKEEINVSIASFFDEGWTLRIGDEVNGYTATGRFYDFDEMAREIEAEICVE